MAHFKSTGARLFINPSTRASANAHPVLSPAYCYRDVLLLKDSDSGLEILEDVIMSELKAIAQKKCKQKGRLHKRNVNRALLTHRQGKEKRGSVGRKQGPAAELQGCSATHLILD